MHIRLLAVLGLAGLLAGCGATAPGIDVGAVDRVVLSDDEGTSVTVVDKKIIGLLAEAVDKAGLDDGRYAVRKLRAVDFQSSGKSLAKIQFHGSLFDLGEKQYIDESNTIGRIAGSMLDAKAPLYGEAECPETLPADREMTLKYTVTNVGEGVVTIAAAFRAHISFLRVEEEGEKPDTNLMGTPAERRGRLDVKGEEPITLAAGESTVYTLTFLAVSGGAGERNLTIRFDHLSESPKEGEVVPPSIPGTILMFQ